MSGRSAPGARGGVTKKSGGKKSGRSGASHRGHRDPAVAGSSTSGQTIFPPSNPPVPEVKTEPQKAVEWIWLETAWEDFSSLQALFILQQKLSEGVASAMDDDSQFLRLDPGDQQRSIFDRRYTELKNFLRANSTATEDMVNSSFFGVAKCDEGCSFSLEQFNDTTIPLWERTQTYYRRSDIVTCPSCQGHISHPTIDEDTDQQMVSILQNNRPRVKAELRPLIDGCLQSTANAHRERKARQETAMTEIQQFGNRDNLKIGKPLDNYVDSMTLSGGQYMTAVDVRAEIQWGEGGKTSREQDESLAQYKAFVPGGTDDGTYETAEQGTVNWGDLL